jgi:hypothetical protein
MSIVKIYCMAHKKYEKLNNDIYIPLQVGAALHNSLGYHSDNTGDNISERNPYYSELTGLYWLYKNDSDCDITGLCHYRRYFINERNEVLSNMLFRIRLLQSSHRNPQMQYTHPKHT